MPANGTGTGKCKYKKSCERPALPGRSMCAQCTEINRIASQRWHAAHKQQNNVSMRQWRAKRIALSLCVRCKAPALPGRHYCNRCLQIQSDGVVKRRHHGIRTRVSSHNPNRTEIIINRLKRNEPYLKRDWATAEPWIRAHIELWAPHADTVIMRSVELETLRQPFNIYLDGVPNYLENGIRLGSLHDPFNEPYNKPYSQRLRGEAP